MHLQVQVVVVIHSVCVLEGRYFSFPFKSLTIISASFEIANCNPLAGVLYRM